MNLHRHKELTQISQAKILKTLLQNKIRRRSNYPVWWFLRGKLMITAAQLFRLAVRLAKWQQEEVMDTLGFGTQGEVLNPAKQKSRTVAR